MKTTRIDLGRLYFETPKGLYVDAFIFPSKRAMHAYIRQSGSDPGRCEAICMGFTRYNAQGHMTKQLGSLCFHRGLCGGGIVSHECAHAAFNWLRNKYPRFRLERESGDIPLESPEEQFCLVLGHIVSQFWSRYFEVVEP